MNLDTKNGYIYIKNNGAKHPTVFTRVLGSFNSGKINIVGRNLARTWTLITEKAFYGQGSITVAHNPVEMVCRLIFIFKENTRD